MKILVTMPTNENHRKKLMASAPEAEFIYIDSAAVDEETVKDGRFGK